MHQRKRGPAPTEPTKPTNPGQDTVQHVDITAPVKIVSIRLAKHKNITAPAVGWNFRCDVSGRRVSGGVVLTPTGKTSTRFSGPFDRTVQLAIIEVVLLRLLLIGCIGVTREGRVVPMLEARA